jgi:two-component system nitrogen regulation response regulator NtrX
LGAGVVDALQGYSWPGNVRELKNVTERMVILCSGPQITLLDVPPAVRAATGGGVVPGSLPEGMGLREARKAFERQFILRHLEEAGWNVPQAAERIALEKSSLYKKMKELDIDPPNN